MQGMSFHRVFSILLPLAFNLKPGTVALKRYRECCHEHLRVCQKHCCPVLGEKSAAGESVIHLLEKGKEGPVFTASL